MKKLTAILAGLVLAAGCGSAGSNGSSSHVPHTPVACTTAISALSSESVHLLRAVERMNQNSSISNQIVAISDVDKATMFAKMANPLISKCEAH